MDDLFIGLFESVKSGDSGSVEAGVEKAIGNGRKASDILEKALVPGIQALGDRFKSGEVFLPEVLIACRAMNCGVKLLKPYLAEMDIPSQGTILLGTVEGDLHDIGKNLVKMMLEANGFVVFDLGIDVNLDVFIKEMKDKSPDIIAISALLTSTMLSMRKVVEARNEIGLESKIKVLIGGAPVTRKFADKIGAEGYAPDCASAVDEAKRIIAMK